SGVSAALLAAASYTGAPATTIADPDVTDIWSDLGQRWHMTEQYLKPQPVCRWAQPAVRAVIDVMESNGLTEQRVRGVKVSTFAAALRLVTRDPANTEEAQYSLPFAVANAVVHGDVGVDSLLEPGDPRGPGSD